MLTNSTVLETKEYSLWQAQICACMQGLLWKVLAQGGQQPVSFMGALQPVHISQHGGTEVVAVVCRCACVLNVIGFEGPGWGWAGINDLRRSLLQLGLHAPVNKQLLHKACGVVR